jgi:iron complex transport system ATP-binding protein
MPAPVLEVSNLSIVRGGVTILDDVNWVVRPGEHWVILGANGSGKTSLLAALTGYFMPTEGELTLLGQRYGESDWRALRQRIGLVSSSIRQMMADSEPAIETVASGRYAVIDFWGRPSAADLRAARRFLRDVECEPLAERPWSYLSQGERQRILIGRALMARPRVLILDEPCAGLDPVGREQFLQFLDRVGRRPRGPALVLVTHHVEEIVPCLSHALLLREGTVFASGPVDRLLTSARLSGLFGASIRLRRVGGRFSLNLTQRSGHVV